MTARRKILFLCTGNSCRSQMAEGWARHLKGNEVEPYSAGIEVHGLNPFAVQVMAEAGVDISGQRSKHVDELAGVEFDCVITVCDRAQQSCPLFPGRTRVVHAGFDDPPRLAESARTEAAALVHYRRVRDQIRAFVETLPAALARADGHPGAAAAAAVYDTAHFDRAAATWDENPTRRALTAAVAAAVRAAVPLTRSATVLDYGCGTAALSVLLAPDVGRVTAADGSPGMVQEAKRKLTAARIANVQPLLLDLTRDPLPPERFDLVVSSMALHHIADTALILRALSELLRPGGWLALADLCVEDGSFHAERTVPHHGFAPDTLAADLGAVGLTRATWRVVHRLAKAGREYPVFLLTAQRPCAQPQQDTASGPPLQEQTP